MPSTTIGYQLMNRRYYFIAAVVILILPITLYISQFGVGLWQSHQQWAEMGSAIGGIYAPILSILTLFVVLMQFRTQKLMQIHQERVTSREICFTTVEKYSIKIESMFTQEVVDDLVNLCNLGIDTPEAKKLKSKHFDIFTLWATVHATIKNYEKLEPRMVIDLASLAVLHLTFNMCATLEETYIAHICNGEEEPFNAWFIENA